MNQVASIRPSDLISLAWSALKRNRLRSLLTVGAIAVGIAVMMYLISLGLGLERLTLDSVAQSSSLLSITVKSGSDQLQPLNQDAFHKIKAIPKVKEVLPQLTLKGVLSLDNQKTNATIVGVDPDYLQVGSSTPLLAGRYFQPQDAQTMLVTPGFLKLFGLDTSKNPLVIFNVVIQQENNLPDISGSNLDSISVSGIVNASGVAVYMPRQYLEQILGANRPNYDNFIVTVGSLNDVQPVSDALIANGFKISKVIDTVDQIEKVFFWIRAVLAGLGGIAVVVATIGMFNTLTISLLERTREIGIMKALGVKRTDIRRLFLTESVLMGLLGGGIGILTALFAQQLTIFVLALLASLVQGNVPVLFDNQWTLIVGFILFAILISGLTGIFPAQRASRINPIEAIRYE
ncbi:ABC transporter permease [Patescibacteria group bacterium]|nr:ABC transporter permease [Patescibacteria group bacterium]